MKEAAAAAAQEGEEEGGGSTRPSVRPFHHNVWRRLLLTGATEHWWWFHHGASRLSFVALAECVVCVALGLVHPLSCHASAALTAALFLRPYRRRLGHRRRYALFCAVCAGL